MQAAAPVSRPVNASPVPVRPYEPSPPAIRFAPSRQRLRCTWAPLPTPPASTLGENDARIPAFRVTALIVSRTRTKVSAAPTGPSAATDTSYWPAAYSGWICSTVTPTADSAVTILAR